MHNLANFSALLVDLPNYALGISHVV